MKLDLLTNVTVVDNAVRFVYEHSKDNNLMSKEEQVNSKESKEHDYNDNRQGEQIDEIPANTINQVF
jgi:hypothetical protein